ncbi:hypothetical protein [Novipirellula rosea]|uniref:Uncharacterized protein n=1 Tax=Novipirellula rosea TaxID=1031540 RepID=A0ABP8M9A2_9BACT
MSFVPVTIWVDTDFDGAKDSSELVTVSASRDISEANVFNFHRWVYIVDDGPVGGNLTNADWMKTSATPQQGSEYNSGIIVLNVAPEWVQHPKLTTSFNEFGVITSAFLSGQFDDAGMLDAHAVQVLVNGEQRVYQEYAPGLSAFTLNVGMLTPGDGDKITVNLYDDDRGITSFYISLGSIVSKSFIANVYTASGVGSVSSAFSTVDGGDEAASAATLRLQGFGATTFLQFGENPGSPYSNGDFRLYSRDNYAVGFDGTKVQYFEHIDSRLNAGYEFGVFQGEIDDRDRYKTLIDDTSGEMGVLVHGRPDPFLEDGFDQVMTRTSSDIWFKLDVGFSMQNNFAKFSLLDTDSSAFPSNRVWIDGGLVSNYQQSTLVKLWQSSPSLGNQYVVGRSELGVFERQYDLITGEYWIPVED